MRFYQRFETCSYIPPEEEATFNCNEMTSHEARSLKSQSLNAEEITEDTESHDLERRDDQQPQGDEEFTHQHPVEQLESLLLHPQLSHPGHFARSSGPEMMPELTFLTDEQGPAYLIFDHEELVPKHTERKNVQREDQQENAHQLSHNLNSNEPSRQPSGAISLCQLAKLRTKRDIRCA